MNLPDWTHELELDAVLRDVSSDPRSRLFQVRARTRDVVALASGKPASLRRSDRCFAEEHLVRVHGEQLGYFLREHAVWSFYRSEDTRALACHEPSLQEPGRVGGMIVTGLDERARIAERLEPSMLEALRTGRPFGLEGLRRASELCSALLPGYASSSLAGAVAYAVGDREGSRRLFEGCLEVANARGHRARQLGNLAALATERLDLRLAHTLSVDALRENPSSTQSLVELSFVALLTRDERSAERCVRLAGEIGDAAMQAYQTRARTPEQTSHRMVGPNWAECVRSSDELPVSLRTLLEWMRGTR